ncbi:hypothetical protein H9W95_18585 [Flavobacterium lindanitolerans]|nr:hypothetical protein [Flavobacterium lindanitolerans]
MALYGVAVFVAVMVIAPASEVKSPLTRIPISALIFRVASVLITIASLAAIVRFWDRV